MLVKQAHTGHLGQFSSTVAPCLLSSNKEARLSGVHAQVHKVYVECLVKPRAGNKPRTEGLRVVGDQNRD